MDSETTSVTTVYCPYCDDRPYTGGNTKAAEDRAKKHVNGDHPDLPNPFEEDDV